MLRPAASEVAAAAARKTLIEPHEAKDGSPATCWKSRHDGTGKALWTRMNSVAPWRVSGRCGTGWPGAPVDERPSAGQCRCAWPAKIFRNKPFGDHGRNPFAETRPLRRDRTPSPRQALLSRLTSVFTSHRLAFLPFNSCHICLLCKCSPMCPGVMRVGLQASISQVSRPNLRTTPFRGTARVGTNCTGLGRSGASSKARSGVRR